MYPIYDLDAELLWSDILDIRNAKRNGVSSIDLMDKYKIKEADIRNICGVKNASTNQ